MGKVAQGVGGDVVRVSCPMRYLTHVRWYECWCYMVRHVQAEADAAIILPSSCGQIQSALHSQYAWRPSTSMGVQKVQGNNDETTPMLRLQTFSSADLESMSQIAEATTTTILVVFIFTRSIV
jgi:hypothetical protein